MASCPSKSPQGLTCDREDDWISHQMLLHRNDECCKEWYLNPEDRVRWGVVGPKKTRGARVKSEEANGEGDGQEEHMGQESE